MTPNFKTFIGGVIGAVLGVLLTFDGPAALTFWSGLFGLFFGAALALAWALGLIFDGRKG